MASLQEKITDFNTATHSAHEKKFQAFQQLAGLESTRMTEILTLIQDLRVAVPSWALGTGGTRFGRFAAGGEPRNLEEKIEDVALLHDLTRATDSISLHIPWDIPQQADAIKALLTHRGLRIDAVNSNTFQDQPGQSLSYKFGSLCHTNKFVRQQAIDHNLEVIEYGKLLGSNSLTVWLADGSNFPGQHHFRRMYLHTLESLEQIYTAMPDTWTMLVEYKPYEPNFYSMVIPDWGTSLKLCESLGSRANVLVDLGHHLPNTNIEQIVSRLLHFQRLGGFHFNGSQYGDDDLTTGSIKPFQLFLIFHELALAATDATVKNPPVAYMIDASHNTKDPLEDLIQSLENIVVAYAKALLVDTVRLEEAQQNNDVVLAEEVLKLAFLTDVRPLIREARLRSGGALDPLAFFRAQQLRAERIRSRGKITVATGL